MATKRWNGGRSWSETINLLNLIVGILGVILSIVGHVVRISEGGDPPYVKPPASNARLQVIEELALFGWSNSVWTELHGRIPEIDNRNRQEYAVVVYTFAWDPGNEIGYWYVQPFDNDCHTRIGHENVWQARLRQGSDYGVLLAKLRTLSKSSEEAESKDSANLIGNSAITNGCDFPAKLLTFPPSHPGIDTWVVLRAKSRWTAMRNLGLFFLVLSGSCWLGFRLTRSTHQRRKR
jgi:hypothetical protein